MTWARARVWLLFSVLLLSSAGPVWASPASDFAARLTQTVWSLQQLEALLRPLPQSTAPVETPETITSYAVLVAENVAALTALGGGHTTDEQRRVMAEGLKSVASILRDEASLAGNRGFGIVASGLNSLEVACRGAIGR